MRHLLIALALTALTIPAAHAQKKKPACGIDLLPFAEGASWVYQGVAPDQQVPARGVIADAPSIILIKVVSVETKGGNTTVQLEEGFRKVVTKTTITCTKKGMVVDPASFFWAGEPGGGLNMTLTDLKRRGTTYPGAKGFKVGAELREEFKAKVDRKAAPDSRAKIPGGSVEMERELQVAAKDPVMTNQGEFKAVRVEVSLSGRGYLDGDKKTEREMAAGAKAALWFSPGIGLVKVINRFNQAWLLKR